MLDENNDARDVQMNLLQAILPLVPPKKSDNPILASLSDQARNDPCCLYAVSLLVPSLKMILLLCQLAPLYQMGGSACKAWF